MIIIENELKKLDEAKEQFKLIKECLWHSKTFIKNKWINNPATKRWFLFGSSKSSKSW